MVNMGRFTKTILLLCFFAIFSFSVSQANENINSFLVKTNTQNFFVDFGDCSKLEEILNITPSGYFYSIYQIKDMIQIDGDTIIAYSSIKLYIIKNGQVSTINLEESFSPYGIDIVKLHLLNNKVYVSIYLTTKNNEGYILLNFDDIQAQITPNSNPNKMLETIIKNNEFYSYILFTKNNIYFFKDLSAHTLIYKGLDKNFIGYMQNTPYFKCSLIENLNELYKGILQIETIDRKNYILDLTDGLLYFQN